MHMHMAAAIARHVKGPTHVEMKSIIADLQSLQDRIAKLAGSRAFRRELSETLGRDAKGVVEDWQAAVWNIQSVASILDSAMFPGQ